MWQYGQKGNKCYLSVALVVICLFNIHRIRNTLDLGLVKYNLTKSGISKKLKKWKFARKF